MPAAAADGAPSTPALAARAPRATAAMATVAAASTPCNDDQLYAESLPWSTSAADGRVRLQRPGDGSPRAPPRIGAAAVLTGTRRGPPSRVHARTHVIPAIADAPEGRPRTVPEHLYDCVMRAPNKTALRVKRNGAWHEITFGAYFDLICAAARAFLQARGRRT